MGLSRRDFLKMGGSACLVAGAGAALAGCTPAKNSDTTDSAAAQGEYVVGASDLNWSQETDVLIIGTGVAGLSAAMKPALEGRKVTFVDKMHSWGGDSVASCWFMFAYGTKLQADAGLPTTFDQFWEKSKDSLTKAYDYEWYPTWVEGCWRALTTWVDSSIADFGATFQEPATAEELPGYNASVVLPGHGIGSGAQDILTPIYNKLQELGAEFAMDTCAKALVKDPSGAVIGARFQDVKSGKTIDIKAKAVVMATGGFIGNQEMMITYVPNYAPFGSLVNYSMGEGHLMGAAAGAQLSGMDENYTNLMGHIPNATTWGYWVPIVQVLPNGKRFVKEDQSHDSAQAAIDAGYREWWTIFDQTAYDARCISQSVEGNVKSHQDVYCKADTIEDLAAQMDVPVDQLVATFARYDELVASGTDDDFGKKTHLKSLAPPYHALREHACRYKTRGGLIVNDKNLVLDTNDQEIPGLYACGAVSAGSNSSMCLCAATGYYAGESLAEALKSA